jgi:hypothetical protein
MKKNKFSTFISSLYNSLKEGTIAVIDFIKAFLSDEGGELSSKRLAMLFLIGCLGYAFLFSCISGKAIGASEHLIDALVTVILFLGGFTNIDRAIKAYKDLKTKEQ